MAESVKVQINSNTVLPLVGNKLFIMFSLQTPTLSYFHVNDTQLSSIHFMFFHIYNLCHCPCRISFTKNKIERRVTHGSPSAEFKQLSTLMSSTKHFFQMVETSFL